MAEHTAEPRPYVINATPGQDAPCPICGATLKWIEHPFPALSNWSECPMHEAAPDLLAALENAITNAEQALDFMDCRSKYDDHPLKPLLHAIRMPARAAIAKARGRS